MRNAIFTILLTIAIGIVPAVETTATTNESNFAAAAPEESKPNISVFHNYIVVEKAVGCTLEVVSLTGKPVMTMTIDTQSQRVDLNFPKGCYIVRVGNVVRKVSVS